jgi:hypothetical protein
MPASKILFWRGSGCALMVVAAAQIRRFYMLANPVDLGWQLGRRMRKRPGVVTAC